MPGEPSTRTASMEGHRPSMPAAVTPAPGQYPRPSPARHPSTAPDSGIWRDYPLAEIEELIAELKRKVARFALFRSIQLADEASEPGNADAFESMNDALEDISAAALGIELASHQEFLRIRSVARPDLNVPGTNKESGTAA
ncbi:hypothetical protein OOZ51_14535 [Arthrobacter sp. MI7-26]|uniref:hypothetical protein n=1 Tax=Arthrobacter sp. MI7-26 TaxID=2993653 RepID=UPI002248AFBA|nr:hypothetical protein [Arthrobacter sp. MI7-26]MCX2749023.1 hypothetical protein [Arthrobacter sp. MI7-26]